MLSHRKAGACHLLVQTSTQQDVKAESAKRAYSGQQPLLKRSRNELRNDRETAALNVPILTASLDSHEHRIIAYAGWTCGTCMLATQIMNALSYIGQIT
jgi:hypothetical protein